MPVTWEYLGSVLVLTLEGDYDFNAPVRAFAEALEDPRFRPGTALLIDARLSQVSRTSEDFRTRSVWMASLQARGLASRCALVISGEAHQVGMAHMAATHLELRGMELQIFTDREEALQWLRSGNTHAAG